MLHLLEQQLGADAHYSHNANSAFGVAFDIVGLRGITNTSWRWLWLAVAVPFRALTYTRRGEFYVVEIDGERPHEVTFLASWLKPEVTLWISLGNSHAMYYDGQVARGEFDTVEQAIAHEFAQLPAHTQQLVVANGDEPLIVSALATIDVPTEFVQLSDLKSYDVWPEHSEFGFAGGQRFAFSYPLPKETATQLGMTLALMRYLGRETDFAMANFSMPPGRSSHFAGVKHTHLIDSSYNAHLISMRSMIDMFDAMHADKKWLVLGDMIEQGKSEQSQHEQLAKRLLGTEAEVIILVGRRLGRYTEPLLADSTAAIKSFDSPVHALKYIESQLAGGETLLFKGSQYLEWIIEKLLADPADAAKLPRQEPAARRRREKRGLL